ncbi:hypothetical protein B0T22DRAFT_437135 [Podospora appendiculata]|uniref:Uncharacterized protein n=1 Tax=Podospora appendiculata TaxID=314037 RepID=A0AAE0XJD6_9PEZI|nr:hypothetical protein B0T22DRAFT_437135 [Podospora appendiculata]
MTPPKGPCCAVTLSASGTLLEETHNLVSFMLVRWWCVMTGDKAESTGRITRTARPSGRRLDGGNAPVFPSPNNKPSPVHTSSKTKDQRRSQPRRNSMAKLRDLHVYTTGNSTNALAQP